MEVTFNVLFPFSYLYLLLWNLNEDSECWRTKLAASRPWNLSPWSSQLQPYIFPHTTTASFNFAIEMIFISSINYDDDEMKIFCLFPFPDSTLYFHIAKSQIFTRGKYKIFFPDRRRERYVTPSTLKRERLCTGENPWRNKLPFPHVNPSAGAVSSLNWLCDGCDEDETIWVICDGMFADPKLWFACGPNRDWIIHESNNFLIWDVMKNRRLWVEVEFNNI